jgi:hypothetical protein
MKVPAILPLVALLFSLVSPSVSAEPDNRVFELRTYHAAEGKLDALLARFRDHTVKLFEKHGITNIGYWVPSENPGALLIYLLAYSSREGGEESWKAFLADPQWREAKAASEVGGGLVAKVESVFLNLADYSPLPKVETRQPARQFELRTYTTAEGRLPDLDARFRGHTIKLFEKHGMTNVAYFHPLADQPGAGSTLIYLLAHKDDASRRASFDSFRRDADWQAAREASEAGGPILVKDGVKSVPLEPVDFSPFK